MPLLRERQTWVLAVCVLVLSAIFLLWDGAPWWGDDLWGQEVVGRAQIVILPCLITLAGQIGINDAANIGSALREESVAAAHRAHSLASVCLVLAAGYVTTHAFIVGASALAPLSFRNGSALPAIEQWLVACLATTVGYALGWAWRRLAAGVAAAMVTPLILFGAGTWAPGGLAELSTSGSLLGYAPDPALSIRRVGWLVLALALLCFLAIAIPRRRVVLVSIGIAWVAGMALTPSVLTYHPVPLTAQCWGARPSVCGPAAFDIRGPAIAEHVHEVAGALVTLGVQPPDRYDIWTIERDSSRVNWILAYDPGRIRAPWDPLQVTSDVVGPSSCALWSGEVPPSDSWFSARDLVVEAVTTELTPGAHGPITDALRRTGVSGERLSQIIQESATALIACDAQSLPPELERLTQ